MAGPKTFSQRLLLAGDIGGTKTNLGIFSAGKQGLDAVAIDTYSSNEASNLEELIALFLDKHNAFVESACFGIAGPVRAGKCVATNLAWEVSAVRIQDEFGWEHVRLLNDLEATALSVPILARRETCTLNKINKGQEEEGGPIGLVAPGTGLGMALLVSVAGRHHVVASEGGHADFAPNSELEMALWQHQRERFGHVSIERVLSGPGLVDIYTWLRGLRRHCEPAWLTENMDKLGKAPAISQAALRKSDPLCEETLNLFVSVFGAVAGNFALTNLTMGGIYLGGGIAPKILAALKGENFLSAFTGKGRFQTLLQRVPVKVILNEKAALLGAAYGAYELIIAR